MRKPLIGLDIDGILANYVGGVIERAQEMGVGDMLPRHWRLWTKWYDGDRATVDRIVESTTNDEAFWASLAPLCDPKEIVFPVAAYITARPCPGETTVDWLRRHGFPNAPVATVPYGASKVAYAKKLALELFVDDNYTNFRQLNDAGVRCLLWDTPANQEFNVGDLRVRSFQEVLADYERRTHFQVSVREA